jgi:hypothetical protein
VRVWVLGDLHVFAAAAEVEFGFALLVAAVLEGLVAVLVVCWNERADGMGGMRLTRTQSLTNALQMAHLFFAAVKAVPSSSLALKGEIVLDGVLGSLGDMPVPTADSSSPTRAVLPGGLTVVALTRKRRLASSRSSFIVKRILAADVPQIEELGESK